jgi:hypothetical protein
MSISVSEERLQLLLPRDLKQQLATAAGWAGVSAGAYVRRLLEGDLTPGKGGARSVFPSGEAPIQTRRTGPIDHDRIE